jgi:chromosome segregation ATPase
MDSPEMIIKLLRKYPEFKPMYERVYDMCRNVERMMEMFSKELLELDRNTVQYMIDEMQEDIDRQAAQLNDQAIQLNNQAAQLKDKDTQLKDKNAQIQELLKKIQELQANQ